MVAGIVLLLLLVLLIGYIVTIYNNLVRTRNEVKLAWSNIDVLLVQRHDELPKLVDVCKRYMQHEQETLERVTQARSQVDTARHSGDVGSVSAAEGAMRGSLANLYAVAERYPDLKADTMFRNLSARVSALETAIADRREIYNDAASAQNVRIETFPDAMVAGFFNFAPERWWDYKIEHRTTSGNSNKSWHVVDSASSVAPFSLSDGDGECLVGPVGAAVTPTSHETWYGDTPRPPCLPGLEGRDWRPECDYRYTERVIGPGTHLTVLGQLRSRSVVASIEREVGKVVVEWKHDQAGLLARFDRNHDGQLDAEEWEAVRAAARQQVKASLGSTEARESVVGQTTHGEPFLITPLDGKRLVTHEKHRAALALAASVALALLTAWAAQKAMLR